MLIINLKEILCCMKKKIDLINVSSNQVFYYTNIKPIIPIVN